MTQRCASDFGTFLPFTRGGFIGWFIAKTRHSMNTPMGRNFDRHRTALGWLLAKRLPPQADTHFAQQ
ncbi:MAG: hypothetical protein ACK554_14315 [Erythrobacteraceae bacterium]|jgi:DNA-binding IclR family transcriptional regulator